MASSRPSPEVPPTITTAPPPVATVDITAPLRTFPLRTLHECSARWVVQHLPEVGPVANEPVGVPPGGLRCLRLQPAQRAGPQVAEGVHAPDPGEGQVTGGEP